MSRNAGTLPPPKQRRMPQKRRRANWAVDVYSSVMTSVIRHRWIPAHAPRPEPGQEPQVIQDLEVEHEEEPVRKPGFLEYCWPAIFGILLGVINAHVREKVISMWGEVGDRLVFPFVQLAGRPELGFGDGVTSTLPQLIQQIQFPLYGLYASFSMSRRHKLVTVIVQLAFVSLIASFVLWLLTKPGASHGL